MEVSSSFRNIAAVNGSLSIFICKTNFSMLYQKEIFLLKWDRYAAQSRILIALISVKAIQLTGAGAYRNKLILRPYKGAPRDIIDSIGISN
jgi:hypothetical protein